MDDKKTELFFVFWKERYVWSSVKIKADGKVELWKSMIERMSENAEKRDIE